MPTDPQMKPVVSGRANDDDKWWAAWLALSDADFARADAYWKAHASPMFRTLIANPIVNFSGTTSPQSANSVDLGNGFRFDPSTQRYVRGNGRAVKEDEIRALLLAFLASAADEMEQEAGKMVKGELSLPDWQASQAQKIKDLFIAGYAAGRGGLSQIGEDGTEAIIGTKSGNGLAGTLKKLRRFGKQIENGGDTAESPAQIVNRAGLYAGPAHSMFEAGRRAAHDNAKDEDGNKITYEECNVLDDQAQHCKTEEHTDGCPEVTDQGWKPFGTLPLPGHRTCGSACRCRMKYRPIEKTSPPLTMSETQPITGLILSADNDFSPALMLGSDLPKERNGFKCHYFTKEVLRPGKFTDANEKPWTITPKDIDDAISDFNRALSLGHEPAIQDRHRKDPDRKGYGWVIGAKKNARGGMEWTHQFLGDDAKNEALKRKSSLMLIPDYKDEKGNQFKWWPDHSAMVLNPRLRDLEDFKPALAASDGQAVNAVFLKPSSPSTGEIPMDLTLLRAALGDAAKDQTDEKVLALSAETITKTALQLSDQKEANGVLVGELKDAQARVLSLSASDDDELSPQLLAMGKKTGLASIALALSAGGLTLKQAELLKVKANSAPTLCLSSDANENSQIDELIAFASLGIDDPRPNKPIKRGNPAIPLQLSTEETFDPALQESMIKGANGGSSGIGGMAKMTRDSSAA